MSHDVIGMLRAPRHPEALLEALRAGGFADEDISFAWLDGAELRGPALSVAGEVAGAGMSTGGYLGGALGLFAAAGALLIPGLGPLYAMGPLVGLFTGAVAGAAIGGVAGGLIGMGLPETEAARYDAMIRQGRMLVWVHTASAEQFENASRICLEQGVEELAGIREQVFALLPVEQRYHAP